MRFEHNQFKLFLKSLKNHLHSLIKFSWINTFFYHKHACLRNFPEISRTENFGSGDDILSRNHVLPPWSLGPQNQP